jgi:hypothetical protein
MFKSGFDLLDSRALEKRLEAARAVAVFIFLVGVKLAPSISYDLFQLSDVSESVQNLLD